MLDILAKIYDDGGTLTGAAYTNFEGDPRFLTAIGLRFESASALFRTVADDDTLDVSLGPLVPEPGETLIEVGNCAPWKDCKGLSVCWAWGLTNHQGYSDGVRLEFSERGEASSVVVELIVVASAIKVFVVMPKSAT